MGKPALIFAPGAWYPPTAFDPIIEKLRPHGYTCHTVAFPSVQQKPAVQDLQQDIKAVRSLVEAEADSGKDVIVVSHSWSGLPVNSALDGLSKASREKEGKAGGVVHLAFISAFIPEIGQSLIGAFGGTPPDWYIRDETNGTVSARDPVHLFFHDVPDAEKWAESLRPHAWATKNTPATSAAYLAIPSSYLLCEDDRAIPLFVQELMVEKARSNGGHVVTDKVKTSHTPWLVVPDVVIEYLRRKAGEAL
ncbi:Alpha/beta hydrolase fold-1 [Talaromyces proteolyticus]|uniref:Alpha/beta hydrolase fold-1 n=1 Tax=Talaromyces proteolyticus TaxID=1131652 RepID=A0AAD4KVE5_9EURO|nr:Alpha/beta hydrolase fold-1 [Talaromyces proteolyticus]KAH8696764.1 Alpha/beta hydrolase fold-1 [Talaromyces proteolyticus]